MIRFANFRSGIFICLLATTAAYGQKGCEFNIIGTWRAESPDKANPVLFRFGRDAVVTVLSSSGPTGSSELREVARAIYTLDNPKAPKLISFKAAREGGPLASELNPIEISGFDDTSFTSVKNGSGQTRWVKVESSRYFMVLAGRSGTFYDRSGPAFPILIKMDGRQTQIDAVGVYSAGGKRVFGAVPAKSYNDFLKGPRSASDVLLRLEISGAQYERNLTILRIWERRSREGALVYPDISLDNILLVKQVTESLNQCSEKIKLYKLDWGIEDKISDENPASRTPYLYFKELRRLNESLHVREDGLK